ncbi:MULTISPECIES: terminase small subunit [Aerococcus]|uniref:Terminase small subunit n=6 Tax=Bacteria TaxID=2 RepID=A0ABT4C111_9LACT|nr:MULTISPECIES: terminase small subunit [Aerococcus]MCY3026206.1 terminase small subunit [Aerococcus loyolae]MCY3035181.1 terminase small subunit [Aerococcus mictus]MCY3064233.1 terminase small subunit [Aerococcus mictus]MCY3073086.1 terminase small subunit [Aerococcus mictus]MCY3075221.1 terminase small subunit [Aerococcus mictus]
MVKISPEEKAMKEIEKLALDLMADWPSTRNQQKQFVLEYMKNGFSNATKAAIAAGYTKKNATKQASKMLVGGDKWRHIPPVVEKLKKVYEEKSAELSIASATEIKQFLTAIMRGEVTEPMAITNGEFKQELVDVMPNVTTRRQAAVDLGKSYGLWTDKSEVKMDALVQIVDDIDDD